METSEIVSLIIPTVSPLNQSIEIVEVEDPHEAEDRKIEDVVAVVLHRSRAALSKRESDLSYSIRCLKDKAELLPLRTRLQDRAEDLIFETSWLNTMAEEVTKADLILGNESRDINNWVEPSVSLLMQSLKETTTIDLMIFAESRSREEVQFLRNYWTSRLKKDPDTGLPLIPDSIEVVLSLGDSFLLSRYTPNGDMDDRLREVSFPVTLPLTQKDREEILLLVSYGEQYRAAVVELDRTKQKLKNLSSSAEDIRIGLLAERLTGSGTVTAESLAGLIERLVG